MASLVYLSSNDQIDLAMMSFWNEKVEAAEAKKAEGASFSALLTPKPPRCTGSNAWIHWSSEIIIIIVVIIIIVIIIIFFFAP